ncbi:MAG: hypothetical protein P4L41_12335 [Flavipsychrobacter sp.]|nr:hypothetical protein [Flavipsychrobacter sp.]
MDEQIENIPAMGQIIIPIDENGNMDENLLIGKFKETMTLVKSHFRYMLNNQNSAKGCNIAFITMTCELIKD